MKRILVILTIITIIAAPCFAKQSSNVSATTSLTDASILAPNNEYRYSNVFAGVFSFYIQVIAGGVAGALFSMKFAIEVMHSAMNDDSNPNGLKRAILRFFTHVIVITVGVAMIFTIIGVK